MGRIRKLNQLKFSLAVKNNTHLCSFVVSLYDILGYFCCSIFATILMFCYYLQGRELPYVISIQFLLPFLIYIILKRVFYVVKLLLMNKLLL
jgi:hypothetical protein